MKVLFLDIDGVLNSTKYFEGEEYTTYLDNVNNKNGKYIPEMDMDPSALKLLESICEKYYDLDIVISSTWKRYARLPKCQEFFRNRGFKYVDRMVDATPDLNFPSIRGNEIHDWLFCFDHPTVETYCIVDDDSDMLEEQKPYFVKTDSSVGLTQNDIEAICKILEGNK